MLDFLEWLYTSDAPTWPAYVRLLIWRFAVAAVTVGVVLTAS
jgi:hypothetical protein